ncbi:MAG: response regulator transcription factor [Gammaproteobacteria bacterium]|nr:response regulator transcription factor [Gammaproteobacteria bacterium]MDH5653787.1 response regulator transcription factor [Gammaproteobacteria bacterium]
MTQILLIDDDTQLADLLSEYLARFDITLSSAGRPSEGLARLGTQEFDLVILDIMLPEMDGFEVCKKIRRASDIPIIMLTARGEVMDRIVGLEIGADDYLPKPFEPRELVARIQTILKRSQTGVRNNRLLHFGELVLDCHARQASVQGQPLELSSMEYQLLECLAREAGRTLHRDDILNRLKGIEADIYTRSVDIAVSRLRQKLKPLDLIKTVRGEGYVFIGRPE